MSAIQDHYDIVIVGAGVVGLSLARKLADRRLRVAVLDRRIPQLSHPGTHWRAVAVGFADLLQTDLSAEAFAACGIYRDMTVYDATGRHSLHFRAEEAGQACLGYIVDLQRWQHALLDKVRRQANVTCLMPAQIQRRFYVRGRNRLDVAVAGCERRLVASLIVGADGAKSWLRRQAGIAWSHRDYGQHAMIATVQTQRSHENVARQRFLPHGPLAFLPLADPYQCAVVWTNDNERAQTPADLPVTAFERRLGDAFAAALGTIKLTSERLTFPLSTGHARHYVQPGLALIGDAAHVIHPLAGLGLNLGLADVTCLARLFAETVTGDDIVGGLAFLRAYERRRRVDNAKALWLIDKLQYLFGKNCPPWLALGRDYGLSLLDHCPPLKIPLMRAV